MGEQDLLSNHNVHGWLMDVPGYRENYRNERRHLININESDGTSSNHQNQKHKQRPSSLLSISSEDSINLDELINANFTTDMDDETDLPDLSALDLDDSNEDFWKMDNSLNHLIIPTRFTSSGKKRQNNSSSNRSKYDESEDDDFLFDSKNTSLDDLLEVTEHDIIKDLNFFPDDMGNNKPTKLLQVPRSLPVSPKSLSSSPIEKYQQRMNRSDSMSSENSLNSLSTITQQQRSYHNIYPSASTSTSSIGSHSTTNASTTVNSHQPHYRSQLTNTNTSLSEENAKEDIKVLPSRSISHIGLARRATHIPAPSPPSSKKSIVIPVSPNHTKSSTLVHKKSNSLLTRSTSRIGQPTTRASHIPTPPVRSTTSLGISSIFSSSSPSSQQQQQQQRHSVNNERPKTSMSNGITTTSSSLKSNTAIGLRRAPSTMNLSKSTSVRSTSLRMPSSRSMYK